MNTREIFNQTTFANYKALKSNNSFFNEKVYLYKVLREIKNLKFKDRQNIKILEIGCADGSFSSVLKDEGYDVFAVDISEKAIENAKKNGLQATVVDIERGINFQRDFFDIVIAAEVIEHIYDTDFVLNEIKRVMKKDGYLFITTPNLASLKNRVRLLLGEYPQYSEFRIGDNQAGHIRNYTPKVLKQQLEQHGFAVKKILSPNIIFPMTKKLPLFIKKIAMFLGDIFATLGSHIIVVAKK